MLLLCAIGLFSVACGDVIANTISAGSSDGRATPDSGLVASGTTGQCQNGSLEFRSLLLIKPRAQVNGTTYLISQAEVDVATTGFMTTAPDWVYKLTNGRLCFVPDVYVSTDPITTFSDTCGGQSPWIADVASDLQQLAPAGKYDTAFLYAPNASAAGSCAYWPTAASNDTAFAYLDPPGENSWQDPDHYIYQHVIWAWTTGFCGFYKDLSGVQPPSVPDPRRGSDYGYSVDQAPYPGWMTYYGDILNRAVMQSGVPSGLGEPAWAHGTIRAAAAP